MALFEVEYPGKFLLVGRNERPGKWIQSDMVVHRCESDKGSVVLIGWHPITDKFGGVWRNLIDRRPNLFQPCLTSSRRSGYIISYVPSLAVHCHRNSIKTAKRLAVHLFPEISTSPLSFHGTNDAPSRIIASNGNHRRVYGTGGGIVGAPSISRPQTTAGPENSTPAPHCVCHGPGERLVPALR